MIWKNPTTPEEVNEWSRRTLGESLGITCTVIGDDFIEATMPVDYRTVQPYGLLHGGASVGLAETLGSIASNFMLENPSSQMPVGVEINANHLRPATGGYVTGRVKPIRAGRRFHVWNIEIFDESDRLICVSRLTVTVVDKK